MRSLPYGMPQRGSSPLARGLRPLRTLIWGARRIIPARAGFTFRRLSQFEYVADHPRSRGVYDEGSEILDFGQGSSPLARGLPLFGSFQGLGSGIIPARAGFTSHK